MSLPSTKPFLQKRGRLLGALFAAVVVGLVLVYAVNNDYVETVPGPEAPPTYMGSLACKECHEGIYRGWQTTFHAKKFQVANADFIIGDFERENKVTVGGNTTVMSRKGEDFFVTTLGPGGNEGSYRVKYVIGSIWKQRYVTEFPNGGRFVVPEQWNVVTEEWADYYGLASQEPGNGNYWSDRERLFQYKCMGCHTSDSEVTYDEAADTYRTSWNEMGVGCESCHGPGSTHLAADLPDKFDTIFNPPRIPDPRRAAMVCGACHDVGMSQDGQYAYPKEYRPGKELKFHLAEFAGTYPDGSPSTHHQQYNDWKSSGHARAGVMCWDCHSPHVRGKFNRYQLKLPGSLLCSTCHVTVARTGVHSIHSTNNCIGCHMPNTVSSGAAGALRSHRMKVVRPEWTVEAGGDLEKQPNSCNLCHYHRKYDPERLVHFLNAMRKPPTCTACHHHEDDAPEDYEPY